MTEDRWYSRDDRSALKSAASVKGGRRGACKSWLRGGVEATGERGRGMEPAGMPVVNDNGPGWMDEVAGRRYGGGNVGSEAAGAAKVQQKKKGRSVGGGS